MSFVVCLCLSLGKLSSPSPFNSLFVTLAFAVKRMHRCVFIMFLGSPNTVFAVIWMKNAPKS